MSNRNPHRRRARLERSARKTVAQAVRAWSGASGLRGVLMPSLKAWRRADGILGGKAMDLAMEMRDAAAAVRGGGDSDRGE